MKNENKIPPNLLGSVLVTTNGPAVAKAMARQARIDTNGAARLEQARNLYEDGQARNLYEDGQSHQQQ